MAQASGSDFTDDFKDYLQALLIGSFTFGSVFPLAFRTLSDLFPISTTTVDLQVRLFYAVNVVYFVGPLMLGCIGWVSLRKNDDDDLLFKYDLDSFQPDDKSAKKWRWWLRNMPTITLVLLVGVGLWFMRALPAPYHGSTFIGSLLVAHVFVTICIAGMSGYLYWNLIGRPNRELLYFNRAVLRVGMQWLLGLLVSSGLFTAATFSFFDKHEGKKLWVTGKDKNEKTDSPSDRLLSIYSPFNWEKTAKKVDSLLVKPIASCFTNVSVEANLLDATQLDYNDIAIRIKPNPTQQKLLNNKLPLAAADSLRTQVIGLYKCLKNLAHSSSGISYEDSDALDKYLENASLDKHLKSFQASYKLDLDSLRRLAHYPSDTLFTTTMQLMRANQLLPLADNLAEATELIKQGADRQSRLLLAEWVKISRIKGLFFLSTFLNLLLCAWFVIRVANEARIRRTPADQSGSSLKHYRELANLHYLIALTVLLILPLFRTVDETNVSSDRPYWFLNLPELVGNVVQPLPNNNSVSNFGENEVTDRLEQINEQVKSLNEATKKLEKASGDTHKELRDMQY